MTKPLDYDVAIVGGGPAGLATGIGFARSGFSTIVLEKQQWPIDKACGEGLMPAGVAELGRLGVLTHIDQTQAHPFEGVELISQRGTRAPLRFREGYGLGIRRTALSQALFATALNEPKLSCVAQVEVSSVAESLDQVILETSQGPIRSKLVVGADGLRSRIRKLVAEEIETKVRRYGARQHFRMQPWSSFVQVHYSNGIEAYVTPCGPHQVGVAFLWHYDRFSPQEGRKGLFSQCLELFPALKERILNAEPASEVRATGPLRRKVITRAFKRIVLVGDAAGYHDAITGEGVSLSLMEGRALVERFPHALDSYPKAQAQLKAKANLLTDIALFLSRRPYLQEPAFRLLRCIGIAPL